jgi:hypothetical protein
MPTITILHLIVSLAVLLLGTYIWRLTSSRSVLANTLFGTISLLLSAYHAGSAQGTEWAIMLPFFTTMLFGGRAIGTWMRCRKDAELRLPAQLMTAVAGLALTATLAAYATL